MCIPYPSQSEYSTEMGFSSVESGDEYVLIYIMYELNDCLDVLIYVRITMYKTLRDNESWRLVYIKA